jgi:DNA-binding transcriptional ArsR family regulator
MVEYSRALELDHVFSALGDPTRRAILLALAKNSATINEIAAPFPLSLNAVSKHVMVLERAGLLRREIQGRQHRCWVNPRPLREASQWLEHYSQFWEQRLDALEVYVSKKLKSARGNKGMAHGKLH